MEFRIQILSANLKIFHLKTTKVVNFKSLDEDCLESPCVNFASSKFFDKVKGHFN